MNTIFSLKKTGYNSGQHFIKSRFVTNVQHLIINFYHIIYPELLSCQKAVINNLVLKSMQSLVWNLCNDVGLMMFHVPHTMLDSVLYHPFCFMQRDPSIPEKQFGVKNRILLGGDKKGCSYNGGHVDCKMLLQSSGKFVFISDINSCVGSRDN